MTVNRLRKNREDWPDIGWQVLKSGWREGDDAAFWSGFAVFRRFEADYGHDQAAAISLGRRTRL